MKKYCIYGSLLAISLLNTSTLDAKTEPNRMLVVNELGQYVPFNLDHLSEIRFENVETPAVCEITLDDVGPERIIVSTRMNPETTSYMMGFAKKSVADKLDTDLDVIEFLKRSGAETYDVDLERKNLFGLRLLEAKEQYVILTAAADRYGCWDHTERVSFHAPTEAIVGNPVVTINCQRTNPQVVEGFLTPNADTSLYSYLFGIKGRYQSHYETWKDILGFTSLEDMIYQMGNKNEQPTAPRWTGLDPNQEYEIYVVPLDVNGNPAPLQSLIIPVWDENQQ